MAKRVRKPTEPHEEFVFTVRRPSFAYTFALQRDRRSIAPFEERAALEFLAECHWPERFSHRQAEVRLYGEAGLMEGKSRFANEEPKRGVASVVATTSKFEVWAYLPAQAVWQLGQGMASGTVQHMLANCPEFAPKHSFINSISFEGPHFDPVEYIG